MSLEDIARNAKENAIREAIGRLSKQPEWKKGGAMTRLYMLCIELETTHVTLPPLLHKMKIKL